MRTSHFVGVDSCPAGWIATSIGPDGPEVETFQTFEGVYETYQEAKQILVDIPIGFPEGERRACDTKASDLLGCRGNSVFFPPCRSAAEKEEYEAANEKHREEVGHGLSQQAHSIRNKILQVDEVLGSEFDGTVKESHPELCFAALNDQPIAYPKSSETGRAHRMQILNSEGVDAESVYGSVREQYLLKDVGRDDILDSIALAVAASRDLVTVPKTPAPNEPRMYYPPFNRHSWDSG